MLLLCVSTDFHRQLVMDLCNISFLQLFVNVMHCIVALHILKSSKALKGFPCPLLEHQDRSLLLFLLVHCEQSLVRVVACCCFCCCSSVSDAIQDIDAGSPAPFLPPDPL